MSSWLSSVLCIVLWKRYGASHLNFLLAIFNPNLIIQKKLKVLYHFGYFFQTGFLVGPIFPACSSAAENGIPTTFKVVPGAPGLVSMLALETRSSGFQPPVSIPASTTINQLHPVPSWPLVYSVFEYLFS